MRQLFFLALVILGFSLSAKADSPPFLQNRKQVNLKTWQFKKGDVYGGHWTNLSTNSWEGIEVPHTFNMDAIDGIGYYQGVVWYRKNITNADFVPGERIFIRFEGVGQEAQLYLNGQEVGRHSGSYGAFSFELTNLWQFDGENILSLKVDNSLSFSTIPTSNFLFNAYGGVYRPVALFSTPKDCVSPLYFGASGVFVEAKQVSQKAAQLEIRSHLLLSDHQNPLTLSIKILDPKGQVVAAKNQQIQASAGEKMQAMNFEIAQPELWHGKQNPALYKAEVELISGNSRDRVLQPFGIRHIEVDANKGLLLNGEPYRVNGVCRHQEWEQNANALTNAQHETDVELINEMGATGLRLAHYQQADYVYQLADESGLIVWAEIPFVHTWTGREHDNAQQQLKELILQNYNHPSICFWGLWNEVRANGDPNAPCVELTQALNALAHSLDPSRPTTSASDREVTAPMSRITDLQGWNKYYGWYYTEYEELGQWLEETHRQYPDLKISVSEYGAGGNIAQQDLTKLEKPVGRYFPEQEQTICHELSWAAIRDKDYVWGSFVWNMFDFGVNDWYRGGKDHRNHKGLVTFDRKEKKDAFYFYKANWSTEPVLHLVEKRNNWRSDAITTIKVYSNFSEKVTLYLNGKAFAKGSPDDLQRLEWKNVPLQEGENHILVKLKHKGEYFQDEMVITKGSKFAVLGD
ncbi:glycoside hydrolase family 2 protein [Persicobacter diffluens]|uniref:Beta-galactosidase n=1 Tax=Persicobacter diffluens TaxID=981 RepID=A0AAN5ALW5_9BACT|nr:beta-galactosidase [Persicobacter diffluens]